MPKMQSASDLHGDFYDSRIPLKPFERYLNFDTDYLFRGCWRQYVRKLPKTDDFCDLLSYIVAMQSSYGNKLGKKQTMFAVLLLQNCCNIDADLSKKVIFPWLFVVKCYRKFDAMLSKRRQKRVKNCEIRSN